VRGLRKARIGAIGTRPSSFTSVRYSEKILEAHGISVEVIDLSAILQQIKSLSDSDGSVKTKLSSIRQYVSTRNVPNDALSAMAKLGVVIDRWMEENELCATAIQCWTNLQDFLGVVPCTLMSMMGSSLLPSACEVDIAGLIGMYTLQLASGSPSAIVDWNNNYSDDPDKCVLFHCSNFPKEFYETPPTIDRHEILASVLPIDQTWGTLQGRIKSGPVTLFRVSTDDITGELTSYIAEGKLTNDPAVTWGGIGVVQVPELQELLRFVCKRSFEHHVAINLGWVSESIVEALREYLGWQIHWHEGFRRTGYSSVDHPSQNTATTGAH
jgi:L-fucose isomerase-like protein